MKYLAILFIALSVDPALARDGNGSSGIGSARVPIVGDIYVPRADDFRREGAHIVRDLDNRVILTLTELTGTEAARRALGSSPAQLGAVKGWEYIPDRDLEAGKQNIWIVCGSGGECVEARADSEAGHDAAALLGALTK